MSAGLLDRLIAKAIMNVGRREFLTSSSAALGAAALPRRARAADPFRIIITETQIPLVPNSVEWLALSLGYFKRAGVDVDLIKVGQTPSAVAALRSGGGEMANIGTDTALQLIGRNQMRLHGVVSPDKALPFVIAAKRTISKIGDLTGKNVRRRARRQRGLRNDARRVCQARREPR